MPDAPQPPSPDFLLGARLIAWLNLLDAAFTSVHLWEGTAVEANPLMAAAWNLHPAAFFCTKIFVVAGALRILRAHHRCYAARAGIGASLLAYAGVICWHLAHL